ncbi:MAG: RluA family pseudouridine synthase [Bacteroidetes bacterium]|nr:RluA family pseudouridine synthase [Bacteroidota bacterium]
MTDHKPNDLCLIAEKQEELFSFLIAKFPQKSRTKIKSALTHKQVLVDGKAVSQYDFKLKPGQKVSLCNQKKVYLPAGRQGNPKGIDILYEDEDIIIVNKKSGILSVSTQNEKQNTVFHRLVEYLQQEERYSRPYVVHRLDQYTSGIMMFAKSEKIQEVLRNAWKDYIDERVYVAVVEGRPAKEKGQMVSWLKENKMYRMYSSQAPDNGKKSITHYSVLQSNDMYSLVEVHLDTGRKNQIRVHFQDIGHPVAGDRKYGAKTDPCGRLMLHARSLVFKHPANHEKMEFDTGIPDFFVKLLE